MGIVLAVHQGELDNTQEAQSILTPPDPADSSKRPKVARIDEDMLLVHIICVVLVVHGHGEIFGPVGKVGVFPPQKIITALDAEHNTGGKRQVAGVEVSVKKGDVTPGTHGKVRPNLKTCVESSPG